MSTRLPVGANVLVRFFTGEPPDIAKGAKALVEDAEQGKVVLEIVPVIVAGTLHTLESYYGLDRKAVAQTLLTFLGSPGVGLQEKERFFDARGRHQDHNVHFADAYLAATAAELRIATASFDSELVPIWTSSRTFAALNPRVKAHLPAGRVMGRAAGGFF